MKKFRRTKRLVIGILVSIMMTLQLYNVTFAATAQDFPVPQEVKSADGGYRELKVIYNDQVVSSSDSCNPFQQFLRKYNDDPSLNENQRFDIKGTATFRARAFAYATGDKVKVGTYIECLGEDGKWFSMFECDWSGDTLTKQEVQDIMENKNDVTVTISNIRFTLPKENPDEKHLWCDLTITSGGKCLKSFTDRQSKEHVQFAEGSVEDNGQFIIERTIEEVATLKNVWKVTLKVTAKGKMEIKANNTDVVLLIDKSSSMENNNRISIVKNSSKKMIENLTNIENTNVAIVSFGGSKGNVTEICQDFTSDADQLKAGIDKALQKIEKGTPLANGFETANKLLQNRITENKIIVLLSDGAPSVVFNGSEIQENDNAKNSSITYADKAKSANVNIYTVAAGDAITDYGKETLRKCASSSEMALVAGDNEDELTNKLSEISSKIYESAVGAIVLDEKIDSNHFKLYLPAKEDMSNVKKVENEAEINKVDWKENSAAITQGVVKELSNETVKWEIGDLQVEKPAFLAYCVEMTQGMLDQEYDIYSSTQLSYKDQDDTIKTIPLKNKKIKAAWAKIRVYWRYKNATSNPNANALLIPPKDVWYKVPDDYDASKGYNFNASTTLVDLETMEIVPDGETNPKAKVVNSIAEAVIADLTPTTKPTSASTPSANPDGNTPTPSADPTPTLSGDESKPKIISEDTIVKELSTKSENEVENEIIPLIGSGYNYIQPEGLANVGLIVKINKLAVKQMKCKVDLSNAINTEIAGNKALNWDLDADELNIEIVNTKTNSKLVKNTDYIVSMEDGSKICITFTSEDIYYLGDELSIKIYSEVKLGTKVKYFGDTDSYCSDILKSNPVVDVAVKIDTLNQIGAKENGDIIWDTNTKSVDKDITMRYTDLPEVH